MPDETRVWIAQCLCGPNRHAIIATAGEFGSEAEAQELLPRLDDAIATLLKSGLNPWCALCGAEQPGWTHELGRTRFRSMDEAAPALVTAASGNAVTNAIFGTHGPARPKEN